MNPVAPPTPGPDGKIPDFEIAFPKKPRTDRDIDGELGRELQIGFIANLKIMKILRDDLNERWCIYLSL